MLGQRGRHGSDLLPGEAGDFLASVLDGLSMPQKSLPSRFFYDARGSDLFEKITRLPEYYPTRTETAILETHAAEMIDGVPDGSVLVEFGSGSSRKTEILLKELPKLGAYVPIDVSQSALEDAKLRINARFPHLAVYPVIGDFFHSPTLPASIAKRKKTGFFPGSTFGNFEPAEGVKLLDHFRTILAPGGRLIVGVDLKKDPAILIRAYDDAAGVTAAFNLNLLARINHEIDGAFDLEAFRHKAIYNPGQGRIEMHLESKRDQEVCVAGHVFHFRAGETIHTENAYKYAIAEFRDLARTAHWLPHRVWTDEDGLFSVHELIAG